ncbi:hypothetical protein H920_17164 [Fukomys damarensis]|uniref:Uncharacterized protein n=1 Tax=Fukomys damarensis TaxID=885580 RepID=A0A091CU58_FUKDA|nr:hypothetical protein H920_17164 [Fukomys damarensis]
MLSNSREDAVCRSGVDQRWRCPDREDVAAVLAPARRAPEGPDRLRAASVPAVGDGAPGSGLFLLTSECPAGGSGGGFLAMWSDRDRPAESTVLRVDVNPGPAVSFGAWNFLSAAHRGPGSLQEDARSPFGPPSGPACGFTIPGIRTVLLPGLSHQGLSCGWVGPGARGSCGATFQAVLHLWPLHTWWVAQESLVPWYEGKEPLGASRTPSRVSLIKPSGRPVSTQRREVALTQLT